MNARVALHIRVIQRLWRLATLPWLAPVLCIAGGVVYLLQAISYAHSMDVTMDEGTYLMKGLLYVKGVYRPFQDYGPITNKMPLSFLIPGAAQAVFGPGLRTGRYFSIFLGLLLLVAVALAGKRLAGRWGAVAAVWAVAASPTNIMYYTVAISQVVTACLLAWSLALTLGRGRPLWQLLLGALFASLTVMTRQNMAPVVPLLLLYVFWENGWRKGLWSALAAFLTLVVFHAMYWSQIMTLWTPYLPGFISRALRLAPGSLGGGVSAWQQSYEPLTKWFVFWEGIRSNFPALVGAAITWILWLPRKKWGSDVRFKAAAILSLMLVILTGLHMWASFGQAYCLFCYSGYLAFFNMTGFLLVIAAFPDWQRKPGAVRSVLVVLLVLLFSTGLGFGAYQQLVGLMTLQVPRIRNMQFQGGTTDLWRLLANKFGWSFEALQKLIPTVAGAAAGIAILIAALVVFLLLQRSYRKNPIMSVWQSVVTVFSTLQHKQPTLVSYGYIATLLFFISGVLLSPGGLMAGWRARETCGGDVIASHEAVGAHLAALVPAGSLVYWENDISPLPLLYIPGVRVFPPQLNHWYTYLQGGDPDELERLGYWNYELAQRWKLKADYLLVAERYVQNWAPVTDNGAVRFDELSPAPQTVPCRDRSIIHIFRRVK